MGVLTLFPCSLHMTHNLLPCEASEPKYSGKHCSVCAGEGGVDDSVPDGEYMFDSTGPEGTCADFLMANGVLDSLDADVQGSLAAGEEGFLPRPTLANSDTSSSLNNLWVKGVFF